jgi:hypothetical protein
MGGVGVRISYLMGYGHTVLAGSKGKFFNGLRTAAESLQLEVLVVQAASVQRGELQEREYSMQSAPVDSVWPKAVLLARIFVLLEIY